MIHFVGAGPGAPDLITLRGARLLEEADVVIYAGSLVNPALLDLCREDCAVHDSSCMTLEEVVEVMRESDQEGKNCVRLHTGDPSLYGAHREQMDELDRLGIDYDVVPGVSSLMGAAAALRAEYTLPGVSQSVVVTRMEGRTPMPRGEAFWRARNGSCLRVDTTPIHQQLSYIELRGQTRPSITVRWARWLRAHASTG